MAFLDKFNDDGKLAIAKANGHPRVKRWVGVRSGSSRREYVCYMCGKVIDQESAQHAPTKHAETAIREHAESHD